MNCSRCFLLLFALFGLSFANYSPFKWLLSQASYGNFLTGDVQKSVGDSCERSVDCVLLANTICVDSRCQCQKGFFATRDEDKRGLMACKKALDFHQSCRNALSETQRCREPFVCSSNGICDCPDGFSAAKDNTKCIQNCEPNHVLVKSKIDHTEACVPLLDLGETCAYNEQCSTRYAQCLTGRCQCIPGTLRKHQQCVTVQQCPLGDAPLENGYPLICDRNTLKCPEGNYCLFAQFTDSRGFCCPTMKVNCPVGSPLSYGCANCPWETHHCFSYSIGTHQQSMCCPNDCPRNLPIRHGDKCYAIVGHLNHCNVDEQCLSVQNSVCMKTNNETKICQCPTNHILIDGICQKVSKLGGECEKDSDCFVGSNTICRNGYCKCDIGFIPEPIPLDWNGKKIAFSVEHCIAEPTCPSIHGLLAIEHYEDCSEKFECSEGKFCHRWFDDPLKERNYSLCCTIPNVRDYEEICAKFGMKMLLANELDQRQTSARPFRCMLPTREGIESGATATTASKLFNSAFCPSDSACVFNPFSIHEGICCRYEQQQRRRNNGNKNFNRKYEIQNPFSSQSTTSSIKEGLTGKINGLFRFPFKKL